VSEHQNKIIQAADYGLPMYFDMQAKMGHTKHLGGVAATNRLAELCQLEADKTLLNVGSGAGISAVYVAKTFGCRVVGVDLLPGMVASSKRRAAEHGLTDQMEFKLGDAQDLPFDDNQFDVLICESVNIFVPDKAKAISEYRRVVKPGGYIGLNEAVWSKEPTQEIAEVIAEATAQQFMAADYWENLLRDAGLEEMVVEHHTVNMREEARNQSGLLSFGSYMRTLGRAIKLMITDRETRALVKYMSSNPRQYFEYMGYGLYVGRKPL
jgi:arsenite methyltransferase